MPTTRLSSKGQIVIPKAIRDAHRWRPGQELEVIDTEDGIVLRARTPFPDTTLDEAYGCLDYDGPSVPTEKLSGTEAMKRRMEHAEDTP